MTDSPIGSSVRLEVLPLKKKTWVSLVSIVSAGVLFSTGLWAWRHPLLGTQVAIPQVMNPKPISDISAGSTIKVMAIGGSVALGWDDKQGKGYLSRAFEELSNVQHIHYQFVNESIEGAGPGQFVKTYPTLLKRVKPNVVVISWGMLDDAARGTPLATFQKDIEDEISLALQSNMKVIIVSPPATAASYTAHYGTLQSAYVEREFEASQLFHSPNVYVIDLLDQMKVYLADHNVSIKTYEADSWHPNTAGHELAGAILAADISQQFIQISNVGATKAT